MDNPADHLVDQLLHVLEADLLLPGGAAQVAVRSHARAD